MCPPVPPAAIDSNVLTLAVVAMALVILAIGFMMVLFDRKLASNAIEEAAEETVGCGVDLPNAQEYQRELPADGRPDPDAEVWILTDNFLAGPKPASCISFCAFWGSFQRLGSSASLFSSARRAVDASTSKMPPQQPD